MRSSNRDWLALGLMLASLFPSSATAETYAFKVTKDGAGKLRCDREGGATAEPAGSIVAKLDRSTVPDQKAELAIVVPGAPDSVFPPSDPSGKVLEFKAAVPASADATVLIREPGNPDAMKCSAIPVQKTARGGSGAGAEPKPLEVQAAAWWQANAVTQLEALRKSGGYPAETRFLVHYPNGEPAPPFPPSLSESEPVQVAIVLPKDEPANLALSVVTCETIQPFRIRGQGAGMPQGERLVKEFTLVAYGPMLRCGAGTLTYSLTVNGATAERSVRIRPIYRLAFTAAYGFDFTRVPSYSVEGGRVAKTSDRAGLGLRLGATWFPFGIDYENMRWWNYVNPVLAVDPQAPTENFLVGAVVTPTGGFGLLVGADVRHTPVPKGVHVGGEIATSDVPTEKVWDQKGVGLYIGISVDDDIFAAIKGRFGK